MLFQVRRKHHTGCVRSRNCALIIDEMQTVGSERKCAGSHTHHPCMKRKGLSQRSNQTTTSSRTSDSWPGNRIKEEKPSLACCSGIFPGLPQGAPTFRLSRSVETANNAGNAPRNFGHRRNADGTSPTSGRSEVTESDLTWSQMAGNNHDSFDLTR